MDEPNKTMELWDNLISNLPNKPLDNAFDSANLYMHETNAIIALEEEAFASEKLISLLKNVGVWTNGDFILCPTEEISNAMCNFIGDFISSCCEDYAMLSGYYDPVEDERNNEADDCTGYYYVDIE